jgi:SanA protein
VSWGALVAVLVFCLALVAVNAIIIRSARPSIVDSTDVPSAQAAIIMGAGLRPDGSPSTMLSDRLDAGVGLYYVGKVKKLLLTGGQSTTASVEVGAMLKYVLALGVPAKDVFTDSKASGTYESLFRASAVFKVKSALLITQAYNLSRAVYTARALGIDATGVPADVHAYPGEWKYFVRDWMAGAQALIQLHVTHPEPHPLGSALPITGDGRSSRS